MGWERVPQEAQCTSPQTRLQAAVRQEYMQSRRSNATAHRSWSLHHAPRNSFPSRRRGAAGLCLGKVARDYLSLSGRPGLPAAPVPSVAGDMHGVHPWEGVLLAHRVTEPSGPVSSLCLSASRPPIHVFNADSQTNNIALPLAPSHL